MLYIIVFCVLPMGSRGISIKLDGQPIYISLRRLGDSGLGFVQAVVVSICISANLVYCVLYCIIKHMT